VIYINQLCRWAVGVVRHSRSRGARPSQAREGTRELTESAKKFPKVSARCWPKGSRPEASEQKPTALDDEEITVEIFLRIAIET